mmetsp:Transcript_19881/g.59417  ORF Transcript_19881/g.59417 Transcript_19881/m.59417 type:complete len:481 (+) Transcript_19881:68-1510(+)
MAARTVAVVVAAAAAAATTAAFDVDLEPCPDCPLPGWEVFDVPSYMVVPGTVAVSATDRAESSGKGTPGALPAAIETETIDNGVERPWADEGYSELITFGGYSGTGLCTMYDRTEHLNGHTKCPLKKDWYKMWRPDANSFKPDYTCWIDDMTPIQQQSKLHNPPGTHTLIGNCPKAGSPIPNATFRGGAYDFRYGGIRPQDDNPDAALYPTIAKHIEEKVADKGLKVVIKGCSGGTINSYAFLMSQTQAWRDKHIKAWIPMSPVFGGTITSLQSVLTGWQVGGGDVGRCLGRSVAIHLPSVLWMWPHPGENDADGLWNRTETLVQTPSKNYTAYDLGEMLTDMGLTRTKALWELEKHDWLDAFPPPFVDTYSYYGYGTRSPAGWIVNHDFSPETDGPDKCPPNDMKTLTRTWDDGDQYPKRSNARAGVWADAHAKAGFVLKNYGYKGQKHSCSCGVAQCTTDYACMMAKLEGKTPPANCK